MNDAYVVETGDSGVAFKNTRRYVGTDVQDDMRDYTFLVACDLNAGNAVVGTIRYGIEGDRCVGCGLRCRAPSRTPATECSSARWPCTRRTRCAGSAPSQGFSLMFSQKQGLGALLMDAIEHEARQQGVKSMACHVVNHRTDLFPFYERCGFRRTGVEEPFPDFVLPRLTRPSHFLEFVRIL